MEKKFDLSALRLKDNVDLTEMPSILIPRIGVFGYGWMKWQTLNRETTADFIKRCSQCIEKKDGQSMFDLAQRLRVGSIYEKDTKLAFDLYTLAASHGSKQALAEIAFCYLAGTGVCRDDERAVHFFHRAATHDISDGYINLIGYYTILKNYELCEELCHARNRCAKRQYS